MERLTWRLEDQHGNPTDSIILKPYMRYEDEGIKKKLLDRLAYYEDLEEQGRMVIMPCKIGDTVYAIRREMCKWRDIDRCDSYCDGWGNEECWEGELEVQEEKFGLWHVAEFGKTVFLTREEAKNILYGDNNHE